MAEVHRHGSSTTVEFNSAAELAEHIAKLSAMLANQLSHNAGFVTTGVVTNEDGKSFPGALRYHLIP